jgi:hypothetical protein
LWTPFGHPFVDRQHYGAGIRSKARWTVTGMSGNGPSVWTGRALQAENDDLEKVGLALLYPAYWWST